MHRSLKRIAPHAIVSLIVTGLSVGCSLRPSSLKSANHPTWERIPSWAQQRIEKPWWTHYGDSRLTHLITSGLASNPDLAVIAARLDRAESQLSQANAETKPRINIGFGWQDGRQREMDFGPYDLMPLQAKSQLSWEIDLTGKLRSAQRSARFARDAAFWDVHAARLRLVSQIVSTHFLIIQLNGDLALARQSARASKDLIEVSRSQVQAGIIAKTKLSQMQAQHEQITRSTTELQRLRSLAAIQLRTLTANSSQPSSQIHLPLPSEVPNLGLNQLISAHPTLLAAEARVRSAFQLQKSAQLNLLPSLRLNASATGAGSSLLHNYRVWKHTIGPSLDIPVYDPARLAKLKTRKAETIEAAAKYRAAVNNVLGEIHSAHVSLLNRKQQLHSAKREVSAREQALHYAKSRFAQGIVAEDEPLRAKQQLISAKLNLRDLHYRTLIDHINLTRALGGG